MNGAVNQRCKVASASAAVPSRRALSMRWFHIAIVGISLAVSHSASDSSRSPWWAPRYWPIIPPIDRPTKWTRCRPSASSRPTTSAASIAML